MDESFPPDENDNSEAVSESTAESNVTDSAEYPTAVLELDEVFTALAHPRRRYLLYTLVNGNNEETLSELAIKIVAWEKNKSPTEVTDEERNRVPIAVVGNMTRDYIRIRIN